MTAPCALAADTALGQDLLTGPAGRRRIRRNPSPHSLVNMGSQRDGRSVGVRANVEDFAEAGVNEDPLPSMRTVVPWSPPNSICHRRCDRNICQSPAPSGCLCRPPARRRC